MVLQFEKSAGCYVFPVFFNNYSTYQIYYDGWDFCDGEGRLEYVVFWVTKVGRCEHDTVCFVEAYGRLHEQDQLFRSLRAENFFTSRDIQAFQEISFTLYLLIWS
jgi:hypothetical protein